MSAGGRAIFRCPGLDLVNGSKWKTVAAWRSTTSFENLHGSDRWSFHRACGRFMWNGRLPRRTGDRLGYRSRSTLGRFSRTGSIALAPRLLVDADFLFGRKSDWNVCHVLSRGTYPDPS